MNVSGDVLLPLGITLLSNTVANNTKAKKVLLPLGITLLSNGTITAISSA